MPDIRLTERRIADLPIPEEGYVRYWDTEVVGLGVKVLISGRKVYVFKGRLNGKPVWGRSLPRCSETNLAEMRGLALDWKAEIRRGVNPFSAPAEDLSPTVSDLCAMNLEAKADRVKKPLSESHIRDMHLYTSYVERTSLGGMRVNEVEIGDAFGFLAAYHDRPRLHDRLRWWMLNCFELAIKKGMIPLHGNPWHYVDKQYQLPDPEDLPRFTDEEIHQLGIFLRRALENRTRHYYSPVWINFVWFLIRNGTRPNDTRVIQRQWIDRVNGQMVVRHPSTKTGKKIIYLSPESASDIESIPPKPGNPFLFPGKIDHLKNYATSFSLMREETGLTKPPYAIRRWFANVGRRVFSGEIKPVQGLVGWESEEMALRYAGDDEELIESLIMENSSVCARVAGRIDEVLNG